MIRILDVLGILFILVGVLLGIRWYIRHTIARQIADYQDDLLEKHCEEVENMYRKMRGWRHDYHNHIQSMKAYLSMGKLQELDAYFNELDEDLTTVDTVIKTGNVKIDAILNSKISLAAEKNIRVEAKAVIPADLNLKISEIDLSLVIGNLMDNAIEACMKIEEEDRRFIRIYIDILKGQLYLYLMNASEGKLFREGKIYLTTKNKEYHGLGLLRMDKVIEKYHGYLDRQNEDGVFVTEVMLPL